jgi:hypothetical protein
LLLLLALAFLPLEAGAHKGIPEVAPLADPYVYYFPTMYRAARFAPDLVVEAITVNYDSAIVVIKNQGLTQVKDTQPFWVDLYVAPDPMPKAPNETWDRLSEQGIVWAISPMALPLEAGETLTMTYCYGEEPDLYYWPALSHLKVPLASGTEIAVQVDSANVGVSYGAVLESHEMPPPLNYNNVMTTTSVAGSGCGTVDTAGSAGLLPLAEADALPPRPQDAR